MSIDDDDGGGDNDGSWGSEQGPTEAAAAFAVSFSHLAMIFSIILVHNSKYGKFTKRQQEC